MYKVQIRHHIEDECLVPFEKDLFGNGVIYELKTIEDIENYEALKNRELILEAKGQSPVLVVSVDDVVGTEVSNE